MEVHTVPSPSVGARGLFVARAVEDVGRTVTLYRDDLRFAVLQKCESP